ncbi:MAG TPA: ABC transporter substrate-binding protein [Kiloniellaceae bacterium]|nr:ABC transporter substrate-binding protein [Kiloniellaceae bacterium]
MIRTLSQRLAFPLALAALLVAATSPRAEAEDAVVFLEKLQQDTFAQLTDPNLDEAEREARARDILTNHFDTPAIGRFVIGRYWRGASAEEQKDFLAVFEDVIVQRFVPLFEKESDSRFTFGPAHNDDKNPSMSLVSSELNSPSKAPVKVVWRVREEGGEMKVLDVVIEGASMALTLRSEYSSYIRSAGGKLASLTDSLRQKVAQGAFRGEIN